MALGTSLTLFSFPYLRISAVNNAYFSAFSKWRLYKDTIQELQSIVLENDRIWWLPAGTTKSAWTSSLHAPRGIFSTRKHFNLLYFSKVILKAGEKLPNSSDYFYLISFNLIYFIFLLLFFYFYYFYKFLFFLNFCHFLAARNSQLAARNFQLSYSPHPCKPVVFIVFLLLERELLL